MFNRHSMIFVATLALLYVFTSCGGGMLGGKFDEETVKTPTVENGSDIQTKQDKTEPICKSRMNALPKGMSLYGEACLKPVKDSPLDAFVEIPFVRRWIHNFAAASCMSETDIDPSISSSFKYIATAIHWKDLAASGEQTPISSSKDDSGDVIRDKMVAVLVEPSPFWSKMFDKMRTAYDELKKEEGVAADGTVICGDSSGKANSTQTSGQSKVWPTQLGGQPIVFSNSPCEVHRNNVDVWAEYVVYIQASDAYVLGTRDEVEFVVKNWDAAVASEPRIEKVIKYFSNSSIKVAGLLDQAPQSIVNTLMPGVNDVGAGLDSGAGVDIAVAGWAGDEYAFDMNISTNVAIMKIEEVYRKEFESCKESVVTMIKEEASLDDVEEDFETCCNRAPAKEMASFQLTYGKVTMSCFDSMPTSCFEDQETSTPKLKTPDNPQQQDGGINNGDQQVIILN